MKTFKFRITESQIARLNVDIAKFNKLADKLGCSHATLATTEAAIDVDPHHKTNTICDISWHVPHVKFYDCELSGGVVIAGDYSFIGAIHYSRTNGEISMASLEGDTIPDEYKNSLPVCDHCNTKRQRKTTYMMKSNVDGSIMQVGSTCLRDFLGYDVSDLIKALKFTMQFANINANYPHIPYHASKFKISPEYGVREILALTNAVIRAFGWASSTSETHIPTADIVRKICDTPESHEAEFWLNKVIELQKDKTDQNMASEVIKWATTQKKYNEYTINLKNCIEGGTVTIRQFGLLCSAVNSFKNEIKRKIETQATYNNVYLGSIGDRLQLDVKCISTKVFDGYYGETTLYKMIDKDDHLLAWFSSSDLVIPDNRFITIKGTVKKHETFDHAKQTILTRVTRVN